MKRTIFLCVALFAVTILNSSFTTDPNKALIEKKQNAIRSLIINANVTVVLVKGGDAKLKVDGDNYFAEQVMIRQKGKRLVIDAKKNQDLKSVGVIYVPADRLDFIMINSSASLKSESTLETRKLDVVINGTCNLEVTTMGQLNLFDTDYYTFEHTAKVVRKPIVKATKKGE